MRLTGTADRPAATFNWNIKMHAFRTMRIVNRLNCIFERLAKQYGSDNVTTSQVWTSINTDEELLREHAKYGLFDELWENLEFITKLLSNLIYYPTP